MRFQTDDQIATAALHRNSRWHKKFMWLPAQAGTGKGLAKVWLEFVYQRLQCGTTYMSRGVFFPKQYGTAQWQRRVVEYHVAQLLTHPEETA